MPNSENPTLTKQEILDFLRENKSFFKQQFDVDAIMLFGSYARDEATPESDVDILIDSQNKSYDSLFSMKELLEKQFQKKVDIFYKDSVRRFIMRFIKEELIYA